MQTVSTYLPMLCSWFIFALFLFFVVKRRGDVRPGALLGYAVIYAGYLAATLINNAYMERWFDAFLYSLPPFLLASICMSSEVSSKLYVKAATWVFALMAALNLLFELVPSMWSLISEWREECFLGYHTFIGWSLTLGMLFALLDKQYNKRAWLCIIYVLLFFANIALIRPGGAVVGALIILAWLVLPFVRKIFSKWNLLIFIGIVILLFAVLMWGLEPFVNFPPVKLFIENVLHKDLSLSGRLYVWPGVLNYIYQSPVTGYGFGESTQIFYEASRWNHSMVHAHNLFLQCWYEGGIITLILGILMLVYTALKTEPNGDGMFKMILFAVLIMLQSDQDVYYNWYMPAFVCHLYILSMENKNEQKIQSPHG